MSDEKIDSLSRFVLEICAVEKSLVRNGADKHEVLLFRGQDNSIYELLPSLARNRTDIASISGLNAERNLIEMAKYRLPEVFRYDLQPLELLALLQHHGIPTRLLDVTENAFVALYFACCSNESKDGEVIVFKSNEADVANYPVVQAIADSCRLVYCDMHPLSLFYRELSLQPYFLEQKGASKAYIKTDEDADNWIKDCCKKPLFVYAPTRSLRQQMQQGRYILFPNRISTCDDSKQLYFFKTIDPIPKNHECIFRRLIISKDAKKQILQDLKLFGVSKETLFADSVDVICKEITVRTMEKLTGV